MLYMLMKERGYDGFDREIQERKHVERDKMNNGKVQNFIVKQVQALPLDLDQREEIYDYASQFFLIDSDIRVLTAYDFTLFTAGFCKAKGWKLNRSLPF